MKQIATIARINLEVFGNEQSYNGQKLIPAMLIFGESHKPSQYIYKFEDSLNYGFVKAASNHCSKYWLSALPAKLLEKHGNILKLHIEKTFSKYFSPIIEQLIQHLSSLTKSECASLMGKISFRLLDQNIDEEPSQNDVVSLLHTYMDFSHSTLEDVQVKADGMVLFLWELYESNHNFIEILSLESFDSYAKDLFLISEFITPVYTCDNGKEKFHTTNMDNPERGCHIFEGLIVSRNEDEANRIFGILESILNGDLFLAIPCETVKTPDTDMEENNIHPEWDKFQPSFITHEAMLTFPSLL